MLKNRYIEKMGEPLGTHFYALWEQVVLLHRKWAEFVALFGTKSTRIELLNQAAPAFFKMINDVLWDDLLLHIARLTDPPKRGRLTIQSLPKLVKDDAATKKAVEELVKTAINKTNFCREPRNRLLAHTNIDLVTASTALELGTRKQTKEALSSLDNVLNKVDGFYMDSTTAFDHVIPTIGNAVDLLYVLRDGLRAQAAREDRILRGEVFEEDSAPDDL